MQYKVTVSKLVETNSPRNRTRYSHFFTADNILSKDQALEVFKALKTSFPAPEYKVSKPVYWQTIGEEVDVSASLIEGDENA